MSVIAESSVFFRSPISGNIEEKRYSEETMRSDADPAQAMVREALGGSERAMEALVERLSPVIQARVVRSLLRRRSGGAPRVERADVEDLTQSIFLELFRRDGKVLKRWSPKAGLSLENFVGMITERRVISRLNRHRGRERPLDEAVQDVSSCPLPGPESRLASRELLQCVTKRLSRELSELGHTMFELLFVWEGSTEEVGERMEMSPEAVRKWRHRLRQRARQCALKCMGGGVA